MERSDDRRPLKISTPTGDHASEALSICIAGGIRADGASDILVGAMVECDPTTFPRTQLPVGLARPGIWPFRTLRRNAAHEPGCTSGNGYRERSHGKLRDESRDERISPSWCEARVPIGRWRQHCHRIRSLGALGYRPPAPKARGMPPVPWALRAMTSRPAQTLIRRGSKEAGRSLRAMHCPGPPPNPRRLTPFEKSGRPRVLARVAVGRGCVMRVSIRTCTRFRGQHSFRRYFAPRDCFSPRCRPNRLRSRAPPVPSER